MYFTLYELQLNLVHFFDPFHRLWNDVQLSIKRSGMWVSVLMTTIAHNCAYGPWDGSKWWRAIIEAGASYFNHTESDDALFLAMLPRILVDRGIVDDLHENVEEVWNDLKSSELLRVRGPRTATCRWFNWNQAQHFWDSQWHSRLLVLLYCGIEDDWLDADALASSIGGDEVTVSRSEGGGGTSVAANKAEQNKLRDRCKNTLHLATKIHANDAYITKARMILYTIRPLHEYYSDLAHRLRSREAGLHFAIKSASGSEVLPMCAAILGIYDDQLKLAQMGFIINDLVTDAQYKTTSLTDAVVMHQDSKAHDLGDFIVNLIHQRTWSMAHSTHCYPGFFAVLLDDSKRDAALSKMKLHWEAWQAAQDNQLSMYKKMAGRSCFKLTFVNFIFRHLASADFASVPDDVKTLLTRVFSGFSSTKLVEDCFQRIRDRESDRSDKTMSNAAMWMQPVSKKLLSESYKYREVQVNNTADETSGATKCALPEGLFSPAVKKSSMPKEFAKLPGCLVGRLCLLCSLDCVVRA